MQTNTSHFYISPRVIQTINSLPLEDRIAVASAVAGEFLLGQPVSADLNPLQTLVFTIIRSYVERDTCRLQARC